MKIFFLMHLLIRTFKNLADFLIVILLHNIKGVSVKISHFYYDTDISLHEEQQDNANTILAFLPYELDEFIKINVINRD